MYIYMVDDIYGYMVDYYNHMMDYIYGIIMSIIHHMVIECYRPMIISYGLNRRFLKWSNMVKQWS